LKYYFCGTNVQEVDAQSRSNLFSKFFRGFNTAEVLRYVAYASSLVNFLPSIHKWHIQPNWAQITQLHEAKNQRYWTYLKNDDRFSVRRCSRLPNLTKLNSHTESKALYSCCTAVAHHLIHTSLSYVKFRSCFAYLKSLSLFIDILFRLTFARLQSNNNKKNWKNADGHW